MAFNKKFFSNASATGGDVNVFTYGINSSLDAVADMLASGFFDEAASTLKKGNIIMLSDGNVCDMATVTSTSGETPVTLWALSSVAP